MGMADLKQLKVKRDDDFAENDPLAELTRIMGGMPETSGASDADDFGIDLERELMGELEQDLDPPARHPRQPEEPAADAQALPELGQAFEDAEQDGECKKRNLRRRGTCDARFKMLPLPLARLLSF